MASIVETTSCPLNRLQKKQNFKLGCLNSREYILPVGQIAKEAEL